jgi:hypothetical protein
MDHWIDIAKWLAAAVGTVLVIGGLIVGVLAWFLNHVDCSTLACAKNRFDRRRHTTSREPRAPCCRQCC